MPSDSEDGPHEEEQNVAHLREHFAGALIAVEGDLGTIITACLDIAPERLDIFEKVFLDDLAFNRKAAAARALLERAGVTVPEGLGGRLQALADWRNRLLHRDVLVGGREGAMAVRRPGRVKLDHFTADAVMKAIDSANQCVTEVRMLAHRLEPPRHRSERNMLQVNEFLFDPGVVDYGDEDPDALG